MSNLYPFKSDKVTTLEPNRDDIKAFIETMFRYADHESYIAFRSFFHKVENNQRTLFLDFVRVNDPDLIERAWQGANRTAYAPLEAAFYAPIATFKLPTKASYDNAADALSLSLECDIGPGLARLMVSKLLGPPTVVIASGGYAGGEDKVHIHYRLSKPARTVEEKKLLAEARTLARQYVHSDATCDPFVHPLRIPGSVHRKPGAVPRLSRILELNPDNDLQLDDALRLLRLAIPVTESKNKNEDQASEARLGEAEDITAAVDLIPNDNRSWDEWMRVLMAIFAASDGFALDDALRWSAKSEKHDEETTEAQWDHLKLFPPTRIGVGTLFFEARKVSPGWRPLSEVRRLEKYFEPPVLILAEDKNGATEILFMEDDTALRFVKEHEAKIRYCHSHGAWFVWTGAYWRRDETGLAFSWAREMARKAGKEHPDKIRSMFGRAAFAGAVERFARTDQRIAVTVEHWDKDSMLLGTPDGVVDLKTGIMRPSDPSDGITRLTGASPSLEARCPVWKAFLDHTTGSDHELIRFLQMWLGYSLTGITREHALVFVFGPGGNGKGVFVNVATGIMGDYAVTAAMDTFMASSADKHSTDLAMLRGARFVTASETEEGRHWAEARVKQLTGGDKITARLMRQDNFTFAPAFKLMLIGNHKPLLRNVDEAARRRFNLVPFLRFPNPPDLELNEKLRAEWPGILRWMIEGCLDWQKHGFIRPESIKIATEAYFDDQDIFGQWLESKCHVNMKDKSCAGTSQSLFASWSAFAKTSNEGAANLKSFNQMMEKRGFTSNKNVPCEVSKKYKRGFSGVKLKIEIDEDALPQS